MRSAVLLAMSLSLGIAGPAAAQQAMLPPPTQPLAIPEPNYVTFSVETEVDRPAEAVWARIGSFCGIGEWLRATCEITAGDEWSLGSVRVVRENYIEMMVAKTPLSYTYTQPVREGVPFNAYHATLEVRPIDERRSRIIVSFFYDNSMLADDAMRAAEIDNRRQRFETALANMKLLAEGGTLPPAE